MAMSPAINHQNPCTVIMMLANAVQPIAQPVRASPDGGDLARKPVSAAAGAVGWRGE